MSNSDARKRHEPAAPEPSDVDALAEVLVSHQRIPLYIVLPGQQCTGCDDLRGETDGPNSPRHAQHLARVLLASDWLARHVAAQKAKALRDAASCLPGLYPSRPLAQTTLLAEFLRGRADEIEAADHIHAPNSTT